MSSWTPLQKYARLKLGINPAIGDIEIAFYVGETPCGIMTDDTSRVAVVNHVLRLGEQRLQATDHIDAYVSTCFVAPRLLPPVQFGKQPLGNHERSELARLLKADA